MWLISSSILAKKNIVLTSKACLYMLYYTLEGIAINPAGFFLNLVLTQKKGTYNMYVGRMIMLFYEHFSMLFKPTTQLRCSTLTC